VEVGEDEPHFTTAMKYRRTDPPLLAADMGAPVRLSALSKEHARRLAEGPEGDTVRYRLWSPTITREMARLLDMAVMP
jgi:hypothetical protein